MPDAKTPLTPPPAPRSRWRKVGRVLLWLGLFIVVFHRPLVHYGVPVIARLAARQAHLDARLELSGSIFTNLTIENVHVRPDGRGVTPVRAIDIARLHAEFSIPQLLRGGLGELLQGYQMKDATLEFEAAPSQDENERKQKVRIAEVLNNILGQPAAYADRVSIENFNLTVHAPKNVTRIEGFNLLLDPEKAGSIRVDRLVIPGVPVWEHLQAETSYADRNFFIKNLRLAPELVLDAVNFDASQRTKGIGGILLQAHLFGGTAELSLTGKKLPKDGKNLANSYATNLTVNLSNVALEDAAAYFGLPKPPVARLANLALNFSGEPELPRTWKGRLAARVEALALHPAKLDAAELRAEFLDGQAQITTANVSAGQNTVTLTGQIGLPESVNDFAQSEVDATLQIAAPDLPTLTAMLPQPFTGAAQGGGKIALHAGQLAAELAVTADRVASADLGVATARLALKVAQQINPAPPAPLSTLAAEVSGELSGLRFQTFTADTAKLDGVTQGGLVTLRTAEIRRGENAVTAQGTAQLPRDPADFAKMPIDAQFAIQVPQLAAFGLAANGQTAGGHLAGEGALKLVAGALTGQVKLDGGDFTLGDFRADRLAAKITVADNQANIEQLALQLNATDQVVASGQAGLAKPFPYAGALLIQVKDLAIFQPLLAVFGNAQPLTGALDVTWGGKGEGDPLAQSGDFSAALTKGRFGAVDLSEIRLAGLYGPGFAETTELHFVTGQTALAGAIGYREGKIKARDLSLTQASIPVLSGYLIFPFDPQNREHPIPLDQRIAANINTDKLDLDQLLSSFGQTSPVSGTITANLVTGGTLAQPFAHLKVNGQRLQAKAATQFEPGELTLDLHYSNQDFTVGAVVKQPQIQPLTIQGHAPIDLETVVREKKLDPNLPLDFTAKLPPSSLAFVPKIAPQVRRLEGTAGLDIHLAGVLQKPVIVGSAMVDLQGARMVADNVPAIGAFRAKLAFADNTLNFQTFEGEVGGGTFKLGGTVNLANVADPIFALRLQSDEVLALRNDSITVRADADIKVDGPLKAGAVSGSVFVTHSRFFKEIDILPIALPGTKAKPAPRSVQNGEVNVSFPQPPLRDWKFDLTIKTRPDDPFLIRGNLANGAASLNLKLAGTGLAPYLEGAITVEKFEASLPFSTLSIRSGFIAFTKDLPFQPSLDLQAESQTRDYLVHAYIFGRATEPQVQLSSEPPLPNADIVSLLATGTTTSELAGSADALASRAAMLAVKQLYQKMFKRSSAPPPDARQKGDAGSIMDRFQLELGALNNRGGGQEVTARYKVNDQTYLIGDIGVDGSFTGSFKYLLRFR